MNILLDAEQAAFIQAQLQSGQFSNAEAVVAAALKLMATQQADYQLWLEETRGKILSGMEDVQRGDVIDGETFLAELQQRLTQKKSAAL
jgi:antitoxin ParD1/3/4